METMGRLIGLLIVTMLAMRTISHGAEIVVYPEKLQGFTQIAVVGEIIPGDELEFETKAFRTKQAIVFLDSSGGDLRAGLAIGRTIRLKEFVTAVPSGKDCASACGLIWLGGQERLVYSPGRVGFHAAFRLTSGVAQESGSGNALIGAYLNQLDFNVAAVEYFTLAPPDGINWLTQQTAAELRVEAQFINTQFEMPVLPSRAKPRFDPGKVAGVPAPDAPSEQVEPSVLPLPPPPGSPAVPPARKLESPVPAPSPGDFAFLDNRDIYGFDLGEAQRARSASDCSDNCRAERQCLAFSYVTETGKCYLKSGGRWVWWLDGVTSGYSNKVHSELKFLRLVMRPSSDLKGREYSFVLNSKTEDCAQLCESDETCSGFTFSRKADGRCSLKTGNLKFRARKGMIAGVKTAE